MAAFTLIKYLSTIMHIKIDDIHWYQGYAE